MSIIEPDLKNPNNLLKLDVFINQRGDGYEAQTSLNEHTLAAHGTSPGEAFKHLAERIDSAIVKVYFDSILRK